MSCCSSCAAGQPCAGRRHEHGGILDPGDFAIWSEELAPEIGGLIEKASSVVDKVKKKVGSKLSSAGGRILGKGTSGFLKGSAVQAGIEVASMLGLSPALATSIPAIMGTLANVGGDTKRRRTPGIRYEGTAPPMALPPIPAALLSNFAYPQRAARSGAALDDGARILIVQLALSLLRCAGDPAR